MGQSVHEVITHLAPFAKRFLSHEVIDECGAANVFCVQELLSRDAQRFFDHVAQKHFHASVRDHNRPGFISLRGSGLGLGARGAKHVSKFLQFRCTGAGYDRYARKGGLYAQLEFESYTIDLITVHLQAGQTKQSQDVRAAQLKEISSWVTALGSPERPFIICGDFNIEGTAHARGDVSYETLIASLDGFIDLGAESDLATYHPHPQGNPLAHAYEPEGAAQRLDYIFLRPALRGQQIKVTDFHLFFDKPIANLGEGIAGWASDHYGLRATFEI